MSEYDDIEKRLGEGIEEDPRLESGVPQDQRGSDVEFIQMSGLVRPTPAPNIDIAPAQNDLDASRPVSFFEKGVEDVDADMAPGIIEDHATAHQEITPVAPPRSPMSHLREIIDDLTKDVPTATTDPALVAALDAHHAETAAPPAIQVAAEIPQDVEPRVEASTAAEAPPVSLDDVLDEFGSSHPMRDDAPSVEEVAAPPVAPAPEVVAVVLPRPPAGPETQRDAGPAREDKPPARLAPVLTDYGARPTEAETLLDDLGPEPVSSRPAPHVDVYDEIPDEALDYKRQGKRRHRTTGKNPLRARLLGLAATLLIVSAIAVSVYTGYLWIGQRMESPDQLYRTAQQLVARGEYVEASRLFEQIAAREPNDPVRAEALFSAGFAMQLRKPAASDDAQEVIKQSLRLFDQYRKEYPAHAKAARAQTIMGRLNYDAGQYQQAVELLRDPELRLRDPASAVPALRTLARAEAKIGDAEAARSYYLQAVGVQDNHSPDVDYAELGSLYQTRADREQDLDKRIELQQLAIESWTHALEVPGIDPASKQTIRSQLDVLREHLQNEPGMAPAMESLNDAVAATGETAPASGDAPADAEKTPAAPVAPGDAPAPTSETPVSAPQATTEPKDAASPTTPAEAQPAPAANAAPQPGAVKNDGEYIVKQGDTLSSIADAHRTSVDELKELNALKGDKLFDGQHLLLPSAAQ